LRWFISDNLCNAVKLARLLQILAGTCQVSGPEEPDLSRLVVIQPQAGPDARDAWINRILRGASHLPEATPANKKRPGAGNAPGRNLKEGCDEA
jgi:hypothetical protein